jgi:hypothetical protein
MVPAQTFLKADLTASIASGMEISSYNRSAETKKMCVLLVQRTNAALSIPKV